MIANGLTCLPTMRNVNFTAKKEKIKFMRHSWYDLWLIAFLVLISRSKYEKNGFIRFHITYSQQLFNKRSYDWTQRFQSFMQFYLILRWLKEHTYYFKICEASKILDKKNLWLLKTNQKTMTIIVRFILLWNKSQTELA